jgi:hypothetical protein
LQIKPEERDDLGNDSAVIENLLFGLDSPITETQQSGVVPE